MITPKTLKGFRDFLPAQVFKRQYVIDQLKGVFESFGFAPLETPALEYEDILTGKYGEEGDKLMYRFVDNGGRNVALRYDQTVPLSRVVAQYQNELPMPFKRYQIQPVWRAENTQKGRFRELLQCDADVVGTDSALADAEVIMTAFKGLEELGFSDFKILINDRRNLHFHSDIEKLTNTQNIQIIRAIDKLKKIGPDGVLAELKKNGFSKDQAAFVLQLIETRKPTDRLKEIFFNLETLGLPKTHYEFFPTLARGLDYYTGLIFEIEINGYTAGSVCGGGRYNNLIGMFAGKDIPAVGFAYGFDRLMEAMNEMNLFPDSLNKTTMLVSIFSPELRDKSLEASSYLRSKQITTELYLDDQAKIDKQLKYADQKGIPYVMIIGPDEAKNNTITLRDMKTRKQTTSTLEEVINEFKT